MTHTVCKGLCRVMAAWLLLMPTARAEAEDVRRVRPSAPGTIRISSDLQPHVDAMLDDSPTFREQFQRIVSAPKLVITARVDIGFVQRPFRARSCIRRYDSGLLVVSIEIGPGTGVEQREWIAHEFEHVIEQLDGVEVVAMAERRRAGAWYSLADMVETTRATKAGQTVRAEMRGQRSRADKFVN